MNKLALLALLALPLAMRAQAPTTPPARPPATLPAIDFSGTLFANFQYRGDQGPSKAQNKFDVERVYLTFKMPAGERGSIRVTTDLFQQTTSGNDAYYKGWVLRAKYAYFQYDFLKSVSWNAFARAGLLHTIVIDHEESFWPRFISPTPMDRAGWFASADAGIATQVSLPGKKGELYATITNGPGYTSRETDRFKDFAARLTLTPFSGSSTRFLRSLDISPWVWRGAVGSKFVSGGTGQVGTVGSGLDKNRVGAFVGIKDPRLIFGLDFATRTDGSESGANTPASPRTMADSTGRMVAGYVVLRPFNFSDLKSKSPLGLVARWDRVTPNTNKSAYANIVIGGVIWDLNPRTSVSLDYQEQTPHYGPVVSPAKSYFLHLVANF